ncbi:MAG TPA: hypothetical protein VEU29_06540 [Actinomycetota bacterium]|nr:hypothetical protein [Actinomycetota bacterium]
MTTSRSTKTLAVLGSAALVLTGMLAGTADAKKKKKPKPPPPPAGCAAYTPSEWSKDVPVTVIKDDATADKPLTITVPTAEGVGSSSPSDPANTSQDNPVSHVYLNVQVDSELPQVGLYGTLEFTPVWDYDLYFRNNEGVGLAYSAGVAPAGIAPEGEAFGVDGTGNGGHTAPGSENIEGLATDDCTGYLVHIVSSLTPGEDVTLNLWLGEATFTPGA